MEDALIAPIFNLYGPGWTYLGTGAAADACIRLQLKGRTNLTFCAPACKTYGGRSDQITTYAHTDASQTTQFISLFRWGHVESGGRGPLFFGHIAYSIRPGAAAHEKLQGQAAGLNCLRGIGLHDQSIFHLRVQRGLRLGLVNYFFHIV